ncbi:Fe2OG dioxygenase domain-containing protein [Trichostrongylus colubriformis]|uniref:Fe2OG dioxygenase domain-containing protein n=1 Tax=Trichostrongylus colubriformis TaxID=6319 RepID=A0AAN8GCG3_TRICO
MIFALLILCFIFTYRIILGSITPNGSDFVGADRWHKDWLDLCDKKYTKNTTAPALICHAFTRNYELVNVEILNESPTLIIFRNFAPPHYIKDFLEDVRKENLVEQKVVKRGQENTTVSDPARRANGTFLRHTASYGMARMFQRASSLLPFINFASSEHWQVLSYRPGGHYAPHDDYITYTSPDTYDSWMRDYGNRMATFFLLLQSAQEGGGTVFPKMHKAAHPEAGDVVFWTNVNYTGEIEVDALHGGCPVYEGEKIAATLWIRMKGQDLFRSASNQLNIRELMER